MKDVQASGKAFSSQKKNIHHFKTTIFLLFSLFHFAYLNPGQADQNKCGSGSATLLKVNVILDKAGQYIPPKRWNECLKVDGNEK